MGKVSFFTKPCQHEDCRGVAYLIKCLWNRGTKIYRCARCFDDFETPMIGFQGGDGS